MKFHLTNYQMSYSRRETDALNRSGCSEVESDSAQEHSHNEEDNGQEVRSVKVVNFNNRELRGRKTASV
jgi:hypothetical protein